MSVRSLMIQKNENGRWAPTRLLMCAAVAAVLAVLAGVLTTRGLSPAEGWYSYYAYQINEQGAVPYVDFELLFPPLYTYLIAAFTSVFGYGIMALRVFGVVIFAATGVFAALLFEKLTDNVWFGMLAGFLCVSMLQSEVVQVFYDYIRLMDLHVYASIYFFMRFFARLDKGEARKGWFDLDIFLGSLFAVLASMYKQSSGLIFLLFCYMVLIFLLIMLKEKRRFACHLAVSLGVGVLLYGAMLLFLYTEGSLSQYFYYNFKASVSAKGGSIFAMLFGWIGRDTLPFIVGVLGALAMLAGIWWLWRYTKEKKGEVLDYSRRAKSLFAVVALLSVLLIAVLVGVFYEQLQYIFFPLPQLMAILMFAVLLFAAMGFAYIFKWEWIPVEREGWHRYFFTSGCVAILGLAVCTSGGVSESQLALGYGLIAAVILPHLRFSKGQLAAGVLAALMLTQGSVAWSRKYARIYAWWGLRIDTVAEQTEALEAPLLAGIRTDAAYAAMYNGVYRLANEHTTKEEPIFVFPHMPVLYLVTDRERATNTAIQWFDVSTDAAVLADIEVLREAPPKMMVLSTVPDHAVESHERAFRGGKESGLGAMRKFLADFVEEKGYTAVGEYPLCDGYTVTVWVLP